MVWGHIYRLFRLFPFGIAALAVSSNATTKACSHDTFASLGLPDINILSVEAAVTEATWNPANTLNAYPISTNDTVKVCQLTINYTHPGWNDKITAWVSLPVDSWNGRFSGIGGGGWTTGTLAALSQAVFQGYAAASTDGGHALAVNVSSWGLTKEGNLNWPNLQDFSATALDEMTSLGKMATRTFYGKPPKYSYWNGCSTGGRQGHMMAQRYATQYDGILAGAPAINWDKFIPSEFWPQAMMKQLDYYPSECELDAITKHAIEACDEIDGVKDGIISMPGSCQFDPLTVVGKTAQCTSGNETIRISKKGAELVSLIWAGPKDTQGSPLWYGLNYDAPLAFLAGTNCTFCGKSHCEQVPFTISADWIQVFLSGNSSLDLSIIDHERFARLFRASVNQFSSVIGTRDTDLTEFKNAKGKMITWHGMKDQLIFFNGTVDYYSRVLENDPKVHDYYRLFLAPGAEHCTAGIGWYPGDSFQALVDWVENGIAPDTLRAIATPSATGSSSPPLRTADLCAWPKVLTYVAGDFNEASSFTCQ
ncbi:hypothetical protein N7520_005931 [Penicillium odoratum]|uniref:uncharacterized protein n=1 Tax=Penicillium odoratum TaxID=1167516 RepID=UPI002547B413|nr:uncharacterized protein N7520_005931 [Penicillium odoratum]KAJ5758775.1 hypothetical protein N7520_005931 [Penicillium odoratum]